MKTPLILVTGAAGKIGSAMVTQLLEKRQRVRALVRGADERAARLSKLGAEVVVADLLDPVQLEAAMVGVLRVGFVAPWHPHLLDVAATVATAAPRAGVETVVGLTQWLANPSHPALTTRQSWLADRLFAQMPGVLHVTVNPGFYASNSMLMLPMAAQLGLFVLPTGGRRNAPPSDEDIARVMVGALLDPARHAGKVYRPTGPELISGDDMARIFGEVLGRRVRHLELPVPFMMKAVAVQGPRLGIDPFFQTQFQHFLDDSRTGVWEFGGPTTHVRDVAGVEPEDFTTITRRYAKRPENQRTLGNLVRVLWDFMRTPLTPAVDTPRFERRQQHPRPSVPLLSGVSARWAAEHGAGAGLEG